MTKDDRETLRQLEREATKGPWEGHVAHDVTGYPVYSLHGFSGDDKRDEAQHAANLKLLCALRTHATDLLDAHEMLAQVWEWAERESFDAPTASYYRAMQDVLDLLKPKAGN